MTIKIARVLFACVVMVALSFLIGCDGGNSSSSVKTIGINQYMEHPLLEQAREGMMKELTRQGITEQNGYKIIYRNAGGDQPTAVQISNQLVNQKVDLFVAIATPAAQAVCKATKTIPVVFTTITDPVASGLADSESVPGGNKTGVSDRWPYDKQIALIKKLCPTAKMVGIVLNPSESNSEASMKYIRPELEKNGFKWLEVPVANSSEVMGAVRSLVGRCDVIYSPPDNTIVAAVSTIIKVANENKIPYFAGNVSSVEQGAIATYGNNYIQIGVSTAKIIVKIFNEKIKNIGAMPVIIDSDAELVINRGAAEKQGVKIPEDLLKAAKKVY
jgi:putative ABC transport system substrate-binding protein